jgi:hypothetical protein
MIAALVVLPYVQIVSAKDRIVCPDDAMLIGNQNGPALSHGADQLAESSLGIVDGVDISHDWILLYLVRLVK